jgi:hypothetical protein
MTILDRLNYIENTVSRFLQSGTLKTIIVDKIYVTTTLDDNIKGLFRVSRTVGNPTPLETISNIEIELNEIYKPIRLKINGNSFSILEYSDNDQSWENEYNIFTRNTKNNRLIAGSLLSLVESKTAEFEIIFQALKPSLSPYVVDTYEGPLYRRRFSVNLT